MAVIFHQQTSLRLAEKKKLKNFLQALCRKEMQELDSLDFIFCSDEYLLDINKRFLKHDFYTDIISFNLAAYQAPIIGEIYISVERVKDNANKLSMPFQTELLRVIFHGVLHLCGYKDKTKVQAAIMRAKEDEYLSLYHVST